MQAISFAFPFRPTFRRLDLEKRWWHRLGVVIFFLVLLGTAFFTIWVVYSVFAPQITTMPDVQVGDIFDQVAAEKQQNAPNTPSGTMMGWDAQGNPIDAQGNPIRQPQIIPPPPSGTIVKNDPYAPYGGHIVKQPATGAPIFDMSKAVPIESTYKPLDKTIQMPDGSTSRFAGTVSDDSIKAQWRHSKTRQTLKAMTWAALITIVVALFISYLLQATYRALLYVIYGSIVRA
jgi:hypothetical protein